VEEFTAVTEYILQEVSMAKATLSQDERQLVKFVEKLPVSEEDKNGWLERIRGGEMSEELADEIRKKIAEGENEDEHKSANRARYLVELSMLIKRWRFSNQSHNFQRNR
jgi:hypothetical protein